MTAQQREAFRQLNELRSTIERLAKTTLLSGERVENAIRYIADALVRLGQS
jgi:hypothetical protein